MSYPHRTAQRVFDTPLLIARPKMEIILTALSTKLGLEISPEAEVARKAALLESSRKRRPLNITQEGIAVVSVLDTLVGRKAGLDAFSGLTSYDELQEEILEAATNPSVRGILLDIDSPGGEVAGLFDLVDVLTEARELKPMWAVANDSAFSAAYGIATAAERIYMTRTGGVGSVGVIAVHLDRSQANEASGMTYTVFRSGEYKAEHNSLEPLTDHAKSTLQEEIDRLYSIFVDQVARNRGMSAEAVSSTEAQTYHGPNAVDIGLADRIGTIEQAHQELVEELNNPHMATTTSGSTRGSAALNLTSQEENIMAKDLKPAETAPAAAAEETIAAPELKEEEKKDTNILDLEKEAEKRGHQKALTYAREVRELCSLAGKPDLAEEFIGKGTKVEAVRTALIDQKANDDEAHEIVSAHETNAGGSQGIDMYAVQQTAYGNYRKAAGQS